MSKRTKSIYIIGALICIVLAGVLAQHILKRTGSSGIVQADECAQPGASGLPVGDVGCYIMVNGRDIYIVHGNARQLTWGRIEGFSENQNITGKKVAIKIHRFGSNYAISGASDYVRLLN